MPSSYICQLVHFVWSTSGRRNWVDNAWQDRLYAYLGGIARNKGATLLCAGGMQDHVHLLASLPSSLSLAEMVNVLKSNSSNWIHENIVGCESFHWQEGYGAIQRQPIGGRRRATLP
jgi:putative transposase